MGIRNPESGDLSRGCIGNNPPVLYNIILVYDYIIIQLYDYIIVLYYIIIVLHTMY